MAKEFTVTTATLRSKAGELSGKNSELNTKIGELSNLESALNLMWDGDANNEFHNAFNGDIQLFTNFYNAIQNYVTALEQIAEQYDKTEAANQNIANQRTYQK